MKAGTDNTLSAANGKRLKRRDTAEDEEDEEWRQRTLNTMTTQSKTPPVKVANSPCHLRSNER